MRLVSIGDSFTEGVGDERPDGSVRGWADLLAQGIANANGTTIQYANLAIRGRRLRPIAIDQLEQALSMSPLPTTLTFNGGGNDMLRPWMSPGELVGLTEHAVRRCLDSGVQLVLIAGPDPGAMAGLPFGARFNRRGTELTEAIAAMAALYGVPFVDNFNDLEVRKPGYWSDDRLHLNAAGHARVAANLLRGLGYPVIIETPEPAAVTERNWQAQTRYYREHVGPYVWRHFRGRSSGDGRTGKYTDWVDVHPVSR